jgi:hypothetical protein
VCEYNVSIAVVMSGTLSDLIAPADNAATDFINVECSRGRDDRILAAAPAPSWHAFLSVRLDSN